jgi:DNA (cytosine-5)-methyltransferase 1
VKYASVCDGIGAAHVAWSGLGWDCKWTSEIEPFPAAVVEHHFKLPNVGDMTAITEEMLDGYGPIDLLVGGTPCQSFSVAGLRGGLADPRGNLALRFVQLVGVLRPSWVVWENVPGVLSSNGGRDFGTFLGALAELGYGFAYRVLDAQWFGVAQRRRRVFVVAHARDWRCAAAVLFERESLCGNPPTRGKTWERFTGPIAGCSNGGGANGPGRTADAADSLVPVVPPVANPLTARMGKGINTTCDEGQTAIVAFKENMSTPDATVGLGTTLQAENHHAVAFDTTQITSKANYSNPKPGDPCHPLAAGQHAPAVAYGLSTTVTPKFAEELSPTIATPSPSGGGQPQCVAYDIHGTLASKAASTTDCHTALRSRAPGQSEASTTTVVAFTQNSRDEVRQINGDGQIAGALSAEAGMHQTNYVAQGFTYSGYSNQLAWMTGDRTDCLPSSGHSDGSHQGVGVIAFDGGNQSTSDDVHHTLRIGRDSGDAVAFSERTRSCGSHLELESTDVCPAIRSGSNRHQGVLQPMAVRRLTPRECERLQGFPDDYTLVTYRNKPAADGPRYRALGNSMAVPVMRWIGERICAVDAACIKAAGETA